MARLLGRFWWTALGITLLFLPARAQMDAHWMQAFPTEVTCIDISPDGKWMLLSSWGTTFVYRMPDRQLAVALRGSPAVFVGSRLLAIGTAQGLEWRDVPSFRVIWRMNGGRPLQASRDGRWLLAAAVGPLGYQEVQLWQMAPPRIRLALPLSADRAALTADGRFLFTLAESGVIEARATASGSVVRRFPVASTGKLAVSPTGDRIAIANPLGVVVYRGDNGQVLYTFTDTGALPPSSLRFSHDGSYLAAGYGMWYERGWWRLWRLGDGALAAGETSRNEVWTLTFSHDGATLYLAFPDHLRLVDTSAGTILEDWNQPTMTQLLGFVANDEQVAIADSEGVHLRATADGSVVRRYALPHFPLTSTLSADGRIYATYPYNGGITAFRLNPDGSTTRLFTVPLWPDSTIDEPMGLRLSDDGARLFVLDSSNRLHLVQVADGSVTTLAEGVQGYDIVPDGSLVVTLEDMVHLRRVPDGTIVRSFPAAHHLAVVQGGQSLLLATTGRTWRLSLYALQTGALLKSDEVRLPDETSINCRLSVSPDAEVLAFTCGWTQVYTWTSSAGSPRLVAVWRDAFAGLPVRFSHHGEHLAVAGQGFLLAVGKSFSGQSAIHPEIRIPGWLGSAPEHLRYFVRSAQTGELLGEGWVNVLEPLGYARARVLIPVPADRALNDLLVTLRGKPFLQRTEIASSLSGGVLVTGDIDGDNEVTLFDFGRMVAAFGAVAGEPGYDVDADLDGDGEISLWDFAWLVANFGAIGDE